jgi:glycosyltransferase involved in cell wall biosynthesis
VVSTATGDIPAMVRHGHTGLLVPPCDPDAMANAILTLLADPEHAVGMAVRARETIGRYTWPAVREAWASVYQNAGSNPVINPCSVSRQSH